MIPLSLFLAIAPLQLEQIVVLLLLLIVTLLLIFYTAALLRKLTRERLLYAESEAWLADKLSPLENCSMDNLPAVQKAMEEVPEPRLQELWSEIREDSAKRYEDQWLTPLDLYLDDDVYGEADAPSRSGWQAPILLASCGIFAAIFLDLFLHSSTSSILDPGFAWVPLAVGLSTAALVANGLVEARRSRHAHIAQLRLSLAQVLPIFTEHAGVARLIDQMIAEKSELQASVEKFRESSEKMASGDFAEGIASSVRDIMSQEIAPPIQKASTRLGELASHLDERQASDMASLAKHFSDAVGMRLANYLQPLAGEVQQLNRLIGRTKDFLEESTVQLSKNHEASLALNQDAAASMKLMTLAKNDLANEMAEIAEHISSMAATSERMASGFAGEEASLSAKLDLLATHLSSSSNLLAQNLQGSSHSLEMASRLENSQQQQYEVLSQQLQVLIEEMRSLDTDLRGAAQNFTRESDTYVNRTLQSFDQGLSEVVERLIFTSSAIRDAVDALPASLRSLKDHA